jgi:trans-AT polyketide synthase/acyltransferase/oxidoreductase domain-containing protein
VNLIHSPAEPALEEGAADLLLRRGVKIISASAYLGITLPLARRAHPAS